MQNDQNAKAAGARIIHAETPQQLIAVRDLLREYWKSFNLCPCFFDFDEELNGLPGDYAPPDGRLLLAEHEGNIVGCVALRKLEDGICEMKRLYLRPQNRGKGLGRLLAETVMAEARAAGYELMRLDTIEPLMKDAIALYQKLGFSEIAPYRRNPIAGAMFMEKEL
jgi:putative acetyltransferase